MLLRKFMGFLLNHILYASSICWADVAVAGRNREVTLTAAYAESE